MRINSPNISYYILTGTVNKKMTNTNGMKTMWGLQPWLAPASGDICSFVMDAIGFRESQGVRGKKMPKIERFPASVIKHFVLNRESVFVTYIV